MKRDKGIVKFAKWYIGQWLAVPFYAIERLRLCSPHAVFRLFQFDGINILVPLRRSIQHMEILPRKIVHVPARNKI